MNFEIGQKIKLLTGEEVTYLGPGLSGTYPGLEDIQETILAEWEEDGGKCVGTFFLFQIQGIQ